MKVVFNGIFSWEEGRFIDGWLYGYICVYDNSVMKVVFDGILVWEEGRLIDGWLYG